MALRLRIFRFQMYETFVIRDLFALAAFFSTTTRTRILRLWSSVLLRNPPSNLSNA